MQAGERKTLADLGLGEQFELRADTDLAGTDFSVFGLQDGRLSDDRYMVFYNQPSSPEGAVQLRSPGHFALDLARLPAAVTELVLTATHDDHPLSRAGRLGVTFGAQAFDARPALKGEKAVMLIRVYRHAGGWRLSPVAQGFNGGLAALVAHFGGEVAESAPAAPPPAAPVSLVKERQRVLLEKAEREQPALVSLMKTAAVSLEKRGLGEARYRVKLVLDISASMSREYRDGSVQRLAERALALATRLDDDGSVEVYLFGVKAHRRGSLSLDNVGGFVDRMGVQLEGGTHYSPVMTMLREDARAEASALPVLVLFITDGGTSNRDAVIRQMRDASREPLFWKFMGIDQGGVNFDFLEKLDDLTGRAVDNADFFSVPAPIRTPDAELFDLLVNELDRWQGAARGAGILR